MCAKDDFAEIIRLGADLKVTNAYKTCKRMAEIAAKWDADFKDVDPSWKPETAAKEAAAVLTAKEN